jgi:uncharacterized membrane protein HdeD (DUF308 family)
MQALTTGIDARVRRANVVTGLLSIAAGAVIIVWPSPGLLALGILLGAWLVVMGTIAISGSFAAQRIIPDWWLLLLLGLSEVALGVLALANPGATLAAIVTVGGIWGVAIGVMRIVLSFQVKRLPDQLDKARSAATANAQGQPPAPRGAGRQSPGGPRDLALEELARRALGSSSTSHTTRGYLKAAPRSLTKARSSRTVVCAPSLSATAAPTSSPGSSCGTPITAASRTSGCL